MKFLLTLTCISMVCSCQEEKHGEARSARQAEDAAASAAGGEEGDWRYAKYRFSLQGYHDVDTAVRVLIENNVPTRFQLKDLTVGREGRVVEEANLSKVDVDSSATSYAFTGTSELEEGDGEDHGGTYTGEVTLDTDGTVPDEGCCGLLEFVPTIADKLIFVGTKQGEGFGAKGWGGLVVNVAADPASDTSTGGDANTGSTIPAAGAMGQESEEQESEEGEEEPEDDGNGQQTNGKGTCSGYQLVFAKQPPNSVQRTRAGKQFDMRVALWDCGGDIVTDHDPDLRVKLWYKHDGTGKYRIHRWRSCPAKDYDNIGAMSNSEIAKCPGFKLWRGQRKYKKMSFRAKHNVAFTNYRYKATVTVNSIEYHAESNVFDVLRHSP